MDDFTEAQRLFREYEKDGKADALEEAVEILDEIIEAGGTDAQRASNLKTTIGKQVDAEVERLKEKSNITDFSGKLKDIEMMRFTGSSLSPSESSRLWKLIFVKVNHFGRL